MSRQTLQSSSGGRFVPNGKVVYAKAKPDLLLWTVALTSLALGLINAFGASTRGSYADKVLKASENAYDTACVYYPERCKDGSP